ncbi:MAG: hypothetical protein O2839_01405 [Cyanobacteria bacterium]|nr:hypothetical protein [Cyanobacteriota bacterium]MDA1247252.1 hypothetical protein [Cyanobacteriota bacterium]
MALLQRLLLLPLLAPLLLVLLVGALNPRPNTALRLLVWTSPALPIGAWLALAASAGAGLSAASAALALRTGTINLRRQVRRGSSAAEQAWSQPQQQSQSEPAPRAAAGPPRPPGEPAPTVAVPFRVIRKGRSEAPASEPVVAKAAAVGDGWNSPSNDDW